MKLKYLTNYYIGKNLKKPNSFLTSPILAWLSPHQNTNILWYPYYNN